MRPTPPATRTGGAGLAGVAGVSSSRKMRSEPAEPIQHVTPEHPEVHSVGRTGVPTDVEGGAADAQRRGHRARHRPLEIRLTLGLHGAAYVGRTGLLKYLYSAADVAPGQQAVAVHPHDDVVARSLDGCVEAVRRSAHRVVDEADAGVTVRKISGDLVGAV